MHSLRYLLPVLTLVILWSSCRKELEYAQSSGNLEFSRDTVFLDTVFNHIGSSTYSLKVYNRTRDDVEIPSIRLGQGQNSDYRLNVDGVAGKEFKNIPILAEDSLFIFIETTYDSPLNNTTSFLYTDALQFDSGTHLQEVQLVTLVKDAVFLYPDTLPDGTKETILVGSDGGGEEIRVEGFYLTDEQLNFSNERPYVIYGYAVVPEGKELTMAPGTRVHFHKDSGILVSKDAMLKINGELSSDKELMENEVIFEGDRLEPAFENVPGQWGSIWISNGSINNNIDHLTIKNANIGLLVEGNGTSTTTLEIKNTRIYNSTSINLWAKTATITAENCVLGSAGNSSLYCNLGGDYSFLHTTIANYWIHGFRAGSALQIDNAGLDSTSDLTGANFINCIIDGNGRSELALYTNNTNLFEYSFVNCMIKFETGNSAQNPLYDFEDTTHYTMPYLNQDPDFKNVQRNDLRIGEKSFAKGKADTETSLLVPFDILGMDRTIAPDIGAYQLTTEH